MSLSTKYRPKDFDEVCSQSSIIKILNKQLELNQYSNCYMFTGESGTGKTTIARIFANKINNNQGNPIEIDAASNNGVDNIRSIIEDANSRSLESEYKIFIIDECHMITTAGWNAFLKCIEEPPKYTVFIFCTTNPEKIPSTIQNRLMRFSLSRVGVEEIEHKLTLICEAEAMDIVEIPALNYIAKLSNGSVREAISTLEKCMHYSTLITLKNVVECLGIIDYDSLFDITNAIVDREEKSLLPVLDKLLNSGMNISYFIDKYMEFILDLNSYNLFKDLNSITIPSYLLDKIKYSISFEGSIEFFSKLAQKLLDIKFKLSQNLNISSLKISLLSLCRGEL